MVRQVEAIFSHGAFRPLEPFAMPEGTRVHLSVEETPAVMPTPSAKRVYSPKLAHPEDAADFMMEVREAPDAGL